jgi:hypothetical protein
MRVSNCFRQQYTVTSDLLNLTLRFLFFVFEAPSLLYAPLFTASLYCYGRTIFRGLHVLTELSHHKVYKLYIIQCSNLCIIYRPDDD